jgi:hypothetical protein
MSDPCASELTEDYDLPLHIGAIFIVMFISFSGTILPIIASRFASLKVIYCFSCNQLVRKLLPHFIGWSFFFLPFPTKEATDTLSS